MTMTDATKPTYDELADAYRDLLATALAINDKLHIIGDHVECNVSTDEADELNDVVNEHLIDWEDFLFGEEIDE
jgi:hypothetical protein